MILERDDELARLSELVAAAAHGTGRIVLVRGEAGIGKTTLIGQFVSDTAESAHILIGACDDLLTPQALGPLWDMARHESTLKGPLQDGDRRVVREATLDLISLSLRPTAIILEDTQWADEATLDLIKYVGRRIASTHGLLILTYRDTEVYTDHPLRQVLGDLPSDNVVRMSLRRISLSAIATLIADQDFDAQEVLAVTDGNPLFVKQVLASGTDTVPASVSEATLTKAATLSDGARRVLDVVSVSPGSLEFAVVESIVGNAIDELGECRQAGILVVDDDAVAFAHDLQRRAVEDSLTTAIRVECNQRVLDALGPTADPARIVHHAQAAGDVSAIVAFAPLAARAAVAADARRDAISHFKTLGPHLEALAIKARAEVLMEWAAQSYFLDDDDVVELFERCISVHRELGDDRSLGSALALAGRASGAHTRPEQAISYAEEAIAVLEQFGSTPDLAIAYAHRAFLAFFYRDRDDEVYPWAIRALEMSEEVGDEESAITTLNVLAHLRYSRGEKEAMGLMEEALHRSQKAGYRWQEVVALSHMAGMYGDVRDVTRAIDFGKRAQETAARYQIGSTENYSLAETSEYLLWLGDWSAAEDMATSVDTLRIHTRAVAGRVVATIQTRRGRSEAGAAMRKLWGSVNREEGATLVDTLAAAVAEYMWLSGDDDPEILAELNEVLQDGIRLGTPWPSGALAFWMWKLGYLTSVPPGTADFYGWIIDGEYTKAAEFWRERSIPYEEGLALMHGDHSEQIQALRIFDDLGAAATATKVREALAGEGVRVPRGRNRDTRANVAGLTARQTEVLGLLADGLSNTEIADDLFVSHRTIENHVSAVLMKLDVPNRESAVQAARDQGLLPAV